MSNPSAQASTLARISLMTSLASIPTTKSFSILPLLAWTALHSSSTSWRKAAICLKSPSPRPLEVIAGAPIRTPPGVIADTSPTTAFLFSVMWQRSHAFSIFDPVTPSGRKSHRIKWLSVPPVTKLYPFATKAAPSAREFLTTCSWYSLNLGVAAHLSAQANAPIWWLCGPPCNDGKTEKLILSSKSYSEPSASPLASRSTGLTPLLKKIMPARGPRKLLCVVVVTISQYGKG
mmetsp:Transcript_13536/g.39232  ORF Transcript_13536/g.39232 Transcript_13536/m.39232 type:complete len:233 (+) Transcript_13536:84-782(+)